MSKGMNLLNAAIMQLRAEAVKAATTIEAILEAPPSVDYADRIDEVTRQANILAEKDSAIRTLQSHFVSPMADRHHKDRVANGQTAPIPPEVQEKLDAFKRTPPPAQTFDDPYPPAPTKKPKNTKRQNKS